MWLKFKTGRTIFLLLKIHLIEVELIYSVLLISAV